MDVSRLRRLLLRGMVIPAHPLALTRARKFDERRQRALTRYYLAAGAGGIAVGVHTTQFAIRGAGLLRPVLELAGETAADGDTLRIAGIVGRTRQAVSEARLARDLGYHAGLLSLGALRRSSVEQLIAHARAVAEVIPLFGFYLQPAVGGRILDGLFWRRFCEIENVVAIKVAPFDRYQTLEVQRAVVEAGREKEIALYTGNDDHIILDLLTRKPAPFVGGLLGHWAFWTRRAVEHFNGCRGGTPTKELLQLASDVTEANAAVFDPAHRYAGCISGIHEILRGQGLLAGRWCLDERETLSPGQLEAINRVKKHFPHLNDDGFVLENLDRWLR